MKIEMGESLFYSWLRHVKKCQVVQTNWKPSPTWLLHNEEELKRLMNTADTHFQNKYNYSIYKNNSLTQLLLQAEVDVIGTCMSEDGVQVYAIDVAFHESGLNYGVRRETVMRVVKKMSRTAMCMIGYFGDAKGEIFFASPKINNAVLDALKPCIVDLNTLFTNDGYQFSAKVIANDDFNNLVLKPILSASDGVADTSELFIRSYQLQKMFGNEQLKPLKPKPKPGGSVDITDDTLSEVKIGNIAQTLLRKALENSKASDEEVSLMRTLDYSKKEFGLGFPLLVLASDKFETKRYYAKPLDIGGVHYRLCSQWYETPKNNDKPLLLAWLQQHDAISDSP